ncbi:scaffolding protein [Mycobacterium phage JacoRen57]|nr:scaffolding protein [Mycobacterium phage JacoRen57]
MAGDNNTSGQDSENQGGDGNNSNFTPVTFKTQAELDAAFAERATRAANSAKQEALKPLQEAGIGVDEALQAYQKVKAEEDAKKDPATKERERNAQLERELQEYKNKEARAQLSAEIAKDLKVKVGQQEVPLPAELLAGSTKEEIEAHGKAILEFVGSIVGQAGPRPPAYNPLQGQNGQDKIQAGDPLRNFFSTGSFL